MTQTFLAPSGPSMNLAAAGPWEASLPNARKKVFHPFLVRLGLVADGVMVTSPAELNAAPTALDSPEKGRPTTPMMSFSLMAWVTTPGALSGEPSESNCLKPTWQPELALLCWLTASCAPLRMAWPSAAFAPLIVPM